MENSEESRKFLYEVALGVSQEMCKIALENDQNAHKNVNRKATKCTTSDLRCQCACTVTDMIMFVCSLFGLPLSGM